MITFVLSEYRQPLELQVCLGSLALQTDKRFEVIVVQDEANQTPEEQKKYRNIWELSGLPGMMYRVYGPTGDWGFTPRRHGLGNVKTKYVAMGSADIYYVPTYVEYMLGALEEGNDFVYCDALMNYSNINGKSEMPYNVMDVTVQQNRIDLSCFATRTDLINQVGLGTHNGADGEMACKIARLPGILVKKIPFVGFVHN